VVDVAGEVVNIYQLTDGDLNLIQSLGVIDHEVQKVDLFDDVLTFSATFSRDTLFRIYRQEGGQWVRGEISIPDDQPEILFNYEFGLPEVAFSDEHMLVGNGGLYFNQGKSWFFSRDNGAITSQTVINNFGSSQVQLGTALAHNDQHLALIGSSPSVFTNDLFFYQKVSGLWQLSQVSVIPEFDPGTAPSQAAMAMAEDLLVIGIPELDITSRKQGSVQIYRFDGEDWHWQQSLYSPAEQPELDEQFGYAVAVEDGQIMVGTHESKLDGVPIPGSVYVYTMTADAGDWQFQQALQSPDEFAEDSFGSSLSVDQGRLVIGAPSSQEHMTYGQGKAYVYQRDNDDKSWSIAAELNSGWSGLTTAFGWSVSISKDRAVVGDPGYDERGQVEIYQFNGTDWLRAGRLNPLDNYPATDFGFDVLIDNDLLIVSSPDDGSELSGEGEVLIYRFQQGSWLLDGRIIDPEEGVLSGFGQITSLARGGLVIGAPASDLFGERSGAVYSHSLNPTLVPLSIRVGGMATGGELVMSYGEDQSVRITSNGTTVVEDALSQGGDYQFTILESPKFPDQKCTFDQDSGVVNTDLVQVRVLCLLDIGL
jgi:hypothetical protein